MTQQNSALVEESAASARNLGDQARSLSQQIAFFQLDQSGATAQQRSASPAPKRGAPPAPAARPAPAKAKAPVEAPQLTPVSGDEGWDEF
jgi:methyl-accepting chemotaxis protein